MSKKKKKRKKRKKSGNFQKGRGGRAKIDAQEKQRRKELKYQEWIEENRKEANKATKKHLISITGIHLGVILVIFMFGMIGTMLYMVTANR